MRVNQEECHTVKSSSKWSSCCAILHIGPLGLPPPLPPLPLQKQRVTHRGNPEFDVSDTLTWHTAAGRNTSLLSDQARDLFGYATLSLTLSRHGGGGGGHRVSSLSGSSVPSNKHRCRAPRWHGCWPGITSSQPHSLQVTPGPLCLSFPPEPKWALIFNWRWRTEIASWEDSTSVIYLRTPQRWSYFGAGREVSVWHLFFFFFVQPKGHVGRLHSLWPSQ